MSPDDFLIDALRDMWRKADPPPADLTAKMIAQVAAADLDLEWELLALTRDSANEDSPAVRGLATTRILSFASAEGWSLDAEIDAGQVRGHVFDLPGDRTPVHVSVRSRSGEEWSATVDEFGFFAIDGQPTGEVRLVVWHGPFVAVSGWLAL